MLESAEDGQHVFNVFKGIRHLSIDMDIVILYLAYSSIHEARSCSVAASTSRFLGRSPKAPACSAPPCGYWGQKGGACDIFRLKVFDSDQCIVASLVNFTLEAVMGVSPSKAIADQSCHSGLKCFLLDGDSSLLGGLGLIQATCARPEAASSQSTRRLEARGA